MADERERRNDFRRVATGRWGGGEGRGKARAKDHGDTARFWDLREGRIVSAIAAIPLRERERFSFTRITRLELHREQQRAGTLAKLTERSFEPSFPEAPGISGKEVSPPREKSIRRAGDPCWPRVECVARISGL